MRAKYAEAIRKGIQAGKRTRYGDIDDPYYAERSDIIWSFGFGESSARLRELSLKAFKRTWHRVSAERLAGMPEAAHREAEAVFRKAWAIWTKSRKEQEIRLLREKLSQVEKRVEQLEGVV